MAEKAKKDDDQQDAPKAAREAVKDSDTAAEDETYSIDWLVSASAAIGYKPEEIEGALSASPKKNLTIEETKAAVKAWLNAPVKEA